MYHNLPNHFLVGGHQTLKTLGLYMFFLKWEFIFISYELKNNKTALKILNMGYTK